MKRLSLLAAAILAACAGAPLAPYAAAERAARLANDRCQERYGLRPFAAEDYEASLEGRGRWVWGGEGSQPVDGFSVMVSFDRDGRRPVVEVHRDEGYGNPEGL